MLQENKKEKALSTLLLQSFYPVKYIIPMYYI